MKVLIKKALLPLLLLIVPMVIFFGVIKPKMIESKEENMASYLRDQGYSSIEMIDVNVWYNQATFSTDKGDVDVRFTKNGCFQIVY